MWIFTVDGGPYSVQAGDEPDEVVVRARRRQDLDRVLRRLGEMGHKLGIGLVSLTPRRDYQCRVSMLRSVWAAYLRDAVEGIDYRNFKGEVARVLGDPQRDDFMAEVWRAGAAFGRLPF